MKVVLFLLASGLCCGFTGRASANVVPKVISRWKRDAVGALEIVTNNASPIHADINIDKQQVKPCPEKKEPSKIEPGVVFQVVPPNDTLYEVKSLRKSFPSTSQLDLVRCVSRILTIAAIIFSAAVEFYPVAVSMYNIIYDFLFTNKY